MVQKILITYHCCWNSRNECNFWNAEQLADCYPTKRIKQSCWYYSAGPLVIGLHFSGADSSRRDSLIGEDDKTWRGRRYPDKMVIMVPRNLAWGLSSTGGGRGWKQDTFETSLNWTSRGRKRPTFYNTPSFKANSLRIGLEENRPVVTICVSNIFASLKCSWSTKW